MTKETAKRIQTENGMEIMRDHITGEASGLFVRTNRLIPELDKMADAIGNEYDNFRCTREQLTPGEYDYRLYLPKAWFDLWGWR